MKWLPLARAVLAALFLLLPMVAWVAFFEPADCDDKAVHWFSAMHVAAESAQLDEFHEGIAPFVAASESSSRWPRTAFRLRATSSYPLVNLLIAGLHRPGAPWLEVVKWSLFVTALLSVVLVAVVASRTPFGLWPALLTLNIIAWQILPAGELLGPLPTFMMPFLWYAPRTAGSLLVIPAMLALAAGRLWLLAAILAAVFLWHVGLGLLFGFLVLAGAAISWPLNRRLDDFHDRALIASVATLAVGMGLSALTNHPDVDRVVQVVTGLDAPRQIYQRVLATDYSLCALVAVLAVRRAGLLVLRGRLFPRLGRAASPDAVEGYARGLGIAGGAALLGVIALGHASSLRSVAGGESGFFVTTCGASVPVQLPGGWKDLTLELEEQMFVSFGDYLLRLRQSGATATPQKKPVPRHEGRGTGFGSTLQAGTRK